MGTSRDRADSTDDPKTSGVTSDEKTPGRSWRSFQDLEELQESWRRAGTEERDTGVRWDLGMEFPEKLDPEMSKERLGGAGITWRCPCPGHGNG